MTPSPAPPNSAIRGPEARRYGWKLAGLFLVLAVILALGGNVYVGRQQADAREAGDG